jgi:two-component system sensor histidine kinase UhpB
MRSPESQNSSNRNLNKRLRRPAWRGLAFQLLTLVILPISALVIITAMIGLALHQQSMRDLAAERDERTAIAIANTLDEMLQMRLDWVLMIAADVPDGARPEQLSAALAEAADSLIESDTSLAYFSADGERLATSGANVWDRINPADLKESIQSASQTQTGYKILTLAGDADPVLLLTAPSEDASIFAAAIFKPSELVSSALTGIFDSPGGHGVFVVSADHHLIYHIGEGDPPEPISSHPGVSQALQGVSGSTYMDVGEDEHVVAYTPIRTMDWALVIEEPWETIASRTLRVTENAPLLLIPIIMLALLALWFSNRYIVRPLQSLESRAAELGWGNFISIQEPVGGIQEIHNLQAELIHLAGKVRAAQSGLRGYISAITLGQEDERRRLARELHDETLQSLIALNQQLQLIQIKLVEAPNAQQEAQALMQLQELAEQTIQNLRRMTRALRPVYLEELGLVAALEMLARETHTSHRLSVAFQLIGAERRLDPEIELALYRIAQEALNNIVKHADAEQASLRIAFTSEMVTLEVSDEGRGFEVPDSPSAFAPGGHFGLLGLHERAEMIGAQLDIQSKPSVGTRITVILPSDQERSEQEEK